MKTYSFWEDDVFLAPADVIIAGAGFAGLWSAYHLKKTDPALRIIVFDKENFPAGASTRNAGFACFGSLTELVDDLAFLGKEKMKEMVLMRYNGLQQIRQTFAASEVDYAQHGGYELISRYQYPDEASLADDIAQINEVLGEILPKNIFSMADAKISQFGFAGTDHLVENKMEGQLHSGKLMRELVSKVRSIGVDIIYGTGITAFEKRSDAIEVTTDQSIVFKTDKFLICTNALAGELSDLVSITPARGQLLLTSPIEGLSFAGCFHYDEGYYYFRNLDGRVLLGGARNIAFAEEESTEMIITDTVQDEIERFLQEIVIPGKQYTIEKRWSGIMGMADTKFPVIRELEPNVFCATGMGGIGIAIAPEVGRLTAELMQQ